MDVYLPAIRMGKRGKRECVLPLRSDARPMPSLYLHSIGQNLVMATYNFKQDWQMQFYAKWPHASLKSGIIVSLQGRENGSWGKLALSATVQPLAIPLSVTALLFTHKIQTLPSKANSLNYQAVLHPTPQ